MTTVAPDMAELVALAARVLAAAERHGHTIATAESATGGLIGHIITENGGSSGAYQGGWVTYANERKIDDLGVHTRMIEQHGAVSKQVAENMAQGARKRAGTTYAVATTGTAGPTGGSAEKPVGTLWCAVAGPDGIHAERFVLAGSDRSATKRLFTAAALRALLDAMEANG